MFVVHYLQQLSLPPVPPRPAPQRASIQLIEPVDPEFNRRVYRELGAEWKWIDRAELPAERWREYCEEPGLTTLRRVDDDAVGPGTRLVVPRRGGAACVVEDCRRVWLHTYSDDSPAALSNYIARGSFEHNTRAE